MLAYLDRVSIILNGGDSVRSAATELLPKMPNESTLQYDFRLSVAKFTNIYTDIVENLTAKPFEEEIKLVGESIPEQIVQFAEDTDGDGNNLTVFAAEYFFQGVNDGVAWVFVDYPKPDESVRTLADAKANGIRPFWSIVLHRNILDARVRMIGGDRVLNYIKILEPASFDAFDRVRVFELTDTGAVTWELWKIENSIGTIEDSGVLTIPVIPLVPFITGRRVGKSFRVRPPLKAAVELQVTLYQQESNLEFAKTMTAFPMLSASGVQPHRDADGAIIPIRVGPQTVLYAPKDGDGQPGSWSYVEPSAQSLKFLADDIKETKQDLRELGKQPLTAQSGLTVITTAYAAGKSKSAVKQWGNGLKDALENALVITAMWLNMGPDQYDPAIGVYDDYDDLTEEDFTQVMELRKNGDLSQDTVWKEAQRRGILSAEFDPDAETETLLKETPGDGDDEFETPTKDKKR